jgi:hypothetical protein
MCGGSPRGRMPGSSSGSPPAAWCLRGLRDRHASRRMMRFAASRLLPLKSRRCFHIASRSSLVEGAFDVDDPPLLPLIPFRRPCREERAEHRARGAGIRVRSWTLSWTQRAPNRTKTKAYRNSDGRREMPENAQRTARGRTSLCDVARGITSAPATVPTHRRTSASPALPNGRPTPGGAARRGDAPASRCSALARAARPRLAESRRL